jgi:hypothetical protein
LLDVCIHVPSRKSARRSTVLRHAALGAIPGGGAPLPSGTPHTAFVTRPLHSNPQQMAPRIAVVGRVGLIGRAVADALRPGHEGVVGHTSGDLRADVRDVASVRATYDALGPIDGAVSTVGRARWKPLAAPVVARHASLARHAW